MVNENHVLDSLPAYVLDILTDEETYQVAEHLADCASCQAEFLRLQAVADDLPLALTQTEPPARTKEKLMSVIHSHQRKAVPSNRQTFWQQLADLTHKRLPALGLALVVILALGNLLLWRQLSQTNQRASTSMRVVALENTQNSPGALGTLVLDANSVYGTLVVDNLATLDPGKQYQIWLIKGTTRTSGGIFSVNHDGYASLEILAPQPLGNYDSIGVSVEPAGGSPAPTGPKVLGGDLIK